ncbi:MAG: hypothetical protein IH840_11010 [Candidatus Heimdallarchaeota archaeon]|nr:hypothetical protein [Candidatus Heimdallarchaeota archaeon]
MNRIQSKLHFATLSRAILYSVLISISAVGLLYSIMKEKGYSHVSEISDELNNFTELVLGSLLFSIFTLLFIYLFQRSLLRNLDKLTVIIKDSSHLLSWYDSFIDDVRRETWIIYFVLVVFIGSFVHYFLYGYLIVSSFGWIYYLLSLIILLYPNILLGTWTGWIMIAQLFHFYKFTDSDDDLSIGWKKSGKLGDVFSFKYRFLSKFLPINTIPKLIHFDYRNQDRLGGFEPLFKISVIGILLLSRLTTILVPLFTTANKSAGLILIFIFLGIVVLSYFIAFRSLKKVIRFEKTVYQKKYDKRIVEMEKHMEVDLDTRLVADRDDLRNIRKQIDRIKENPRSYLILLSLTFSISLPLIAYFAIVQYFVS